MDLKNRFLALDIDESVVSKILPILKAEEAASLYDSSDEELKNKIPELLERIVDKPQGNELDLSKIVQLCLKYNPDIKFNLEMITRNPLKVPFYQERYWQTFEELSAKEVVGAIKWIRNHQSKMALPSVEGMSQLEKLAYEEQNIIESFKYAIHELKLVN